MKFAVGYQLPGGGSESFVDIARDYRRKIAEVYFSWPGTASARALSLSRQGYTARSARRVLKHELKEIHAMGIKLDLLFNANCYGAKAVSRGLEREACAIIERVGAQTDGVDIVTTVSPFIARTIKKYFPDLEVRASVNMRLGTIFAFNYSRAWFDSYHVQRDLQRNIAYVRKLKQWAGRNGKKLCLLANSGCLRFCPAQTFHDNLVAHDEEVVKTANVTDWNPHLCWSLYADRANWPYILQATWIRPEDLHHYEGLVSVVKLATRAHSHPRLVIHAYASGKYDGNLLDLMEPGFGPAFAPYLIHNALFPAGWFRKTSRCRAEDCAACGYCKSVLAKVLIDGEHLKNA